MYNSQFQAPHCSKQKKVLTSLYPEREKKNKTPHVYPMINEKRVSPRIRLLFLSQTNPLLHPRNLSILCLARPHRTARTAEALCIAMLVLLLWNLPFITPDDTVLCAVLKTKEYIPIMGARLGDTLWFCESERV
jgi:hypothetical protein